MGEAKEKRERGGDGDKGKEIWRWGKRERGFVDGEKRRRNQGIGKKKKGLGDGEKWIWGWGKRELGMVKGEKGLGDREKGKRD